MPWQEESKLMERYQQRLGFLIQIVYVEADHGFRGRALGAWEQ